MLTGYYAPENSRGIYYACPSGTFSQIGAEACIDCPVGTYSVPGSVVCKPCSESHHSGAGNCAEKGKHIHMPA